MSTQQFQPLAGQLVNKYEEEHSPLAQPLEEQHQPPSNQAQKQNQSEQPQEDIIDPIEELTKRQNIVPLLAVLPLIDLNIDIEGKPLLNRLCTMGIPLAQHLKGREIIFKTDADNRTALHQAIAADDIAAAYWCFQNGIRNIKDNFGNTPILEAIKKGRKNCFLLCLNYQFYDSQAPHIAAMYNRPWQLKVLHRMGYDITSSRDSEHFTPLQRAVANYAYDAAEYLSQITNKVSVGYLATKTDSKGIIRLIQRVVRNKSKIRTTLLPLLYPNINVFLIGYVISNFAAYNGFQEAFRDCLLGIIVIYALMAIIGWPREEKRIERHNINILALLQAPEFPVLDQICPQCLIVQDLTKDHCREQGVCLQRYHFFELFRVYKANQVFWFLLELAWLFTLLQLERVNLAHLQKSNLILVNFSNFIFQNCAIIDYLYCSSQFLNLLWFLYLKAFILYQWLCCFQWFCMIVLHRTFREINNTQKYRRLYRIVQTSDGNFKHQQMRIMQLGFCRGIITGLIRTCLYFFM